MTSESPHSCESGQPPVGHGRRSLAEVVVFVDRLGHIRPQTKPRRRSIGPFSGTLSGMQGQSIRVLRLVGGPTARGVAHGRAHAAEIGQYAADRISLSASGTALSRDQLIELAQDCLPAHRAYASDLYDEMEALASAAGLSPSEALVVGGYTDFIDTVRSHAGGGPVTDNCTAAIIPDEAADGAGFLAQTWDMHSSATPHIVMLRIEPESGPASLVFSTVGCLGQIGMNEAGIALGINNLTAADGKIGVTWPFVVRKALQQTDLDGALSCVLDADLAGGHNYLVFDRHGRGVNVEAMPGVRHVTEVKGEPLIHTNHCLVDETRAAEADRPDDLQESSDMRLRDATRLLQKRPVNEEALMTLTRDEAWICRQSHPPYDYQTCGAAIMRPRTGDMWACWGVPSENEYEHFGLVASRT